MSFTKFTIEGAATFGYFGDRVDDDRHVRIIGKRVEQVIAQSLDFPNESEFDQFFQHMEALRQQELQPANGIPDVIRDGVRLRITVEVVDAEG